VEDPGGEFFSFFSFPSFLFFRLEMGSLFLVLLLCSLPVGLLWCLVGFETQELTTTG